MGVVLDTRINEDTKVVGKVVPLHGASKKAESDSSLLALSLVAPLLSTMTPEEAKEADPVSELQRDLLNDQAIEKIAEQATSTFLALWGIGRNSEKGNYIHNNIKAIVAMMNAQAEGRSGSILALKIDNMQLEAVQKRIKDLADQIAVDQKEKSHFGAFSQILFAVITVVIVLAVVAAAVAVVAAVAVAAAAAGAAAGTFTAAAAMTAAGGVLTWKVGLAITAIALAITAAIQVSEHKKGSYDKDNGVDTSEVQRRQTLQSLLSNQATMLQTSINSTTTNGINNSMNQDKDSFEIARGLLEAFRRLFASRGG